jgi:hypothetical protein
MLWPILLSPLTEELGNLRSILHPRPPVLGPPIVYRQVWAAEFRRNKVTKRRISLMLMQNLNKRNNWAIPRSPRGERTGPERCALKCSAERVTWRARAGRGPTGYRHPMSKGRSLQTLQLAASGRTSEDLKRRLRFERVGHSYSAGRTERAIRQRDPRTDTTVYETP